MDVVLADYDLGTKMWCDTFTIFIGYDWKSEESTFGDEFNLNTVPFHTLLIYGLCHEELHLALRKVGIDDMLLHSHIVLHNLYWIFDIKYPYPWPSDIS